LAQIYGELRHPWHFIPSEYLTWSSFLWWASIAALLWVRLGKKRKLVGFASLVIIVANLLQYFFVEVWPVESFVLAGPSRVNMMLGPIAIVLFLVTLKQRQMSDGDRPTALSPNWFNVLLIASTVMMSGLTSQNVRQTMIDMVTSVEEIRYQLALPRDSDLILEPSIDTIGWRSVMDVNIYLDRFFPFEMQSISEYRERWLLLCGTNSISNCALNVIDVRDQEQSFSNSILVVRQASVDPSWGLCKLGETDELVSLIECD
jgi:hypothetical protein